jgi:hypothetical protein
MAQPDDVMIARAGSAAGLIGAGLLATYFLVPPLIGWPYAATDSADIMAFAATRGVLFPAGAWLQVTGTLLCVVLFAAILTLAHAYASLPGLLALLMSAVLLSTVVIEAVLLVAVPIAAVNGDAATAATTFALSNGVFARVFPMAPASATLIALGLVIVHSEVAALRIGRAAIALGVAFELAGLLAILSPVGLVVVVVLSVAQCVWLVAASLSIVHGPRQRHRVIDPRAAGTAS